MLEDPFKVLERHLCLYCKDRVSKTCILEPDEVVLMQKDRSLESNVLCKSIGMFWTKFPFAGILY